MLAVAAGYQERDRSGFKFVVGPRQPRTRPRNIAGDPEEVRRQREARRQQGQEEGSDGEGVGLDWLDNDDGECGGEGSEEGEQEGQLEAQKA